MKVYPECLESSVREELLAHQTFYESSQAAFLLEAFLEHFLRHHPVELVEIALAPEFGKELRARSVDPAALAPKVAARLGARLNRKLKAYVQERPGLRLGHEEIGLGPGDWRKATDVPVEGDLVVHFLHNDRIVYSRPFEDEVLFSAGKIVRSRFLGRTLMKRYGELYVIYQEALEPSLLQPINDLEVRLSRDRDQKLTVEIDPAARRERLKLGERLALCQAGADHALSLIVTPRGQEPQPPRLESFWLGLHPSGVLEGQAVIREPFEMKQGRIQAQITVHHEAIESLTLDLERVSRQDAVQVFRGSLDPSSPGARLAPGVSVDVRLTASNRAGFRLEAGAGPGGPSLLKPLLMPEPLAAPAFLTPAAVERGFSLAFVLGDGSVSGKRFTLHFRRGQELGQVGPTPCRGGRITFEVPPLETDGPDAALEFWIGCEDAAVPLARTGNSEEKPLLCVPVYPIAPGGRPILGSENYLFPEEVLHFGMERLRLVRWAPSRPVRFPAPEHHPYVLWRTQDRPMVRFFLRDGHFVAEGASALDQLVLGAGYGEPTHSGPREMSVPLQTSGRKAYLALRGHESGVEVRKAAGRIHDVALNFEPLGSSTLLRPGRWLLVAGAALLGVHLDRESLELSLLGHTLLDEELATGIQITSDPEVIEESRSWIYVPASSPLTMTLFHP